MVWDKRIIVKALATANQACGGFEIAKDTMKIFLTKLEKYDEASVLVALDKCMEEVKTNRHLALVDVISRIDDGRPGPEQAWSMIPHDEYSSVVWTNEMAAAWGDVRELEGDRVAMRMAFLETYRKRVQDARSAGIPVKWSPSLGHDPSRRESVIRDAVSKGRITEAQAVQFLPESITPSCEKLPCDDVEMLVADVKNAMDAACIENKKTVKLLKNQ